MISFKTTFNLKRLFDDIYKSQCANSAQQKTQTSKYMVVGDQMLFLAARLNQRT